ncbi:MAG: hypothetical protein ABIB79_03325 [archaeon]
MSITLENILIAVIVVVAAILAYLVFVEKKLYKKLLKVQNDRNKFYIKEITTVRKPDPAEILKKADEIAMDFFKEAFGVKRGTEYSKLEKYFKQEKNPEAAKFCNLMNDILYSGKKPNKEDNQKLIVILIDIIKNNQIITPEEKEEIRKEELKKEKMKSYLDKINVFGVSKKELDEKKDSGKQN